ncbi:MAG: type II toxin-antitoxin system VapC family toxin [Calditrichia bacterium]|nr:type II toxin-antitoxin system VapC family toxin [Calditrichia bacterium]
MNLVDSSGWLEYFADGNNASFFAPIIEDTDNLIVSTINIFEVFKVVLSQRGEDKAIEAIAILRQGKVVDVTPKISLDAAKLSYDMKLPMADSIILITARMHNAKLWTQDKDFQQFSDVNYINK